MRGRAQLGALAAADSRKSKSVFKRLTGFIYKMGENNKMIKKKKKTQSPNRTPSTPSPTQVSTFSGLSGTETGSPWGSPLLGGPGQISPYPRPATRYWHSQNTT